LGVFDTRAGNLSEQNQIDEQLEIEKWIGGQRAVLVETNRDQLQMAWNGVCG
jgi:hypothetical protein